MPDLQLYLPGGWKSVAMVNHWTDPSPSNPDPCWPIQPCTKASQARRSLTTALWHSIAITVGHSSTKAWSNVLYL